MLDKIIWSKTLLMIGLGLEKENYYWSQKILGLIFVCEKNILPHIRLTDQRLESCSASRDMAGGECLQEALGDEKE
jgi:hypothetical protein